MVTMETKVIWGARNDPKKLGKEARRVRNRRTSGDYPNYSITEIGQNTEKSHEDLRRLAVPQTPVKDHQLKLVGKTRRYYYYY